MKIKGRGKYQIVDNKLIITSDAKTDYFVNPIDGFTINTSGIISDLVISKSLYDIILFIKYLQFVVKP